MLWQTAVVLLATATAGASPALAAVEQGKNYVKTATGYLMVLPQDDDVIASLERLAESTQIPGASLTGIGFMRDITFGYFDFAKKDFQPKSFHDVEVAGMAGSIAWKDGKPSVHLHATASGRDFGAVGGHVLAAKVGTGSAEITIIAHEHRLERKVDSEIGVDVLQIER